MPLINETHGAGLRSWVESANAADCDFPVQNLPDRKSTRLNSSHRL